VFIRSIIMKRWPGMAYSPREWVDENIREFKTPDYIVAEMLCSMYGSQIPDDWINEARDYVDYLIVGGKVH
jgi:hypothetical protein